MIWDYASDHRDFIKPNSITAFQNTRFRIYCNIDMINALVAVAVSFITPTLAFILLFTKLPMIIITGIFLGRRNRRRKKKLQSKQSTQP